MTAPVLLAAVVGAGGTLVYVYVYSRFGPPTNDALREGAVLPDFPVVEHGREVSSALLVGKPALWIVYRDSRQRFWQGRGPPGPPPQ